MAQPQKSDPRRICVIRLSAIGDVINTIPLVRGLRDGFPDASITWITERLPYEVIRHQPEVDDFIVFHGKNIDGWKQLWHALRGRRFDLAIVPQVSFKAGLVAALVDAGEKLGFDFRRSREMHWLFVNRRLPPRPAAHVQQQYFEFLDLLGVARPVSWSLVLTPDETARASQLRRDAGDYAALVIASSRADKDWPAERYAELCDRLGTRGLIAVLVGGPSRRESQIAAQILKQTKTTPHVALDRPIRDTLVRLAAARVVVGPDTGPLHAAVALGRPTIGLYGATDPRRCGPVRHSDLVIDHYAAPLDAPLRRRRRQGAMATITVDEVLAKIDAALEGPPTEA